MGGWSLGVGIARIGPYLLWEMAKGIDMVALLFDILVHGPILLLWVPFPHINGLLFFALVVLIYCMVIRSSVLCAKETRNGFHPGSRDKWYVYLLVWILAMVLQGPLSDFIRSHVARAYKIPAGSMLPTILIGDHILPATMIYHFRSPNRYEMVVFPFFQKTKLNPS